MDDFAGFDRFVYKQFEGCGLAPPHGIWDAYQDEWVGGAWSTEKEARACASGMNQARELYRQGQRGIEAAAQALRRALEAIEKLR